MELPCFLPAHHFPSTSMCSPTQKCSETHTCWMFMEASSYRHNRSLNSLPALLPSLKNGVWDSKSHPSNYGFVFLIKSPYSRAIQKPTQSCLIGTKYTPMTQEIPRDLVSGTMVKDQTLEQKILLVFLSLRNLQGFYELYVRNKRQRPICIYILFLLFHKNICILLNYS